MLLGAVYKIQSVQTNEYLLPSSTPEDRVRTTSDDTHACHITITPPVSHGITTTSTIQGRYGLFIHPGLQHQHIVWGRGPFRWHIVPIGDNFQFCPDDGDSDLCWFQNKSSEHYVGLSPGKDLVDKEAVFKLIKLSK